MFRNGIFQKDYCTFEYIGLPILYSRETIALSPTSHILISFSRNSSISLSSISLFEKRIQKVRKFR